MIKRTEHSFPVLIALIAFAVIVIVPNISKLSSDSSVFRRRSFMRTLNELANKVPFESIHHNKPFVEFSKELKAKSKTPYLIIYDSSNLDIVFNHICNLQFIPNALSRLVAVSLDQRAYDSLRRRYPSIPSVVVDLEPLKRAISGTENARYLTYTLTLVVHTRIMASLALRGIDFWSMHQDTIWVGNFEQMNVEDRFPDAHLVFDRVGNDDMPIYRRIDEWICAATFFVRASRVYQFFRQTESYMLTHQSPESTVMTYLCGHRKYTCERMPRWMVSSINYFKKPKETSPVLIQLDAPKRKEETKMDILRKNNFVFRTENGTCDEDAFRRLRSSVNLAFMEERVEEEPIRRESFYRKMYYKLKTVLNVDPYNTKDYLKIHYSLL